MNLPQRPSCQFLVTYLKQSGHTAECLTDGYETATWLAHNDCEVAIVDLKMPKVDGIEVLRQVKGDAQLKTIPVVVLTSTREEQDLVRTYDLGVNAYVVKPVDFIEFVDAVKLLGGFWAVVNEPPPGGGPRA